MQLLPPSLLTLLSRASQFRAAANPEHCLTRFNLLEPIFYSEIVNHCHRCHCVNTNHPWACDHQANSEFLHKKLQKEQILLFFNVTICVAFVKVQLLICSSLESKTWWLPLQTICTTQYFLLKTGLLWIQSAVTLIKSHPRVRIPLFFQMPQKPAYT